MTSTFKPAFIPLFLSLSLLGAALALPPLLVLTDLGFPMSALAVGALCGVVVCLLWTWLMRRTLRVRVDSQRLESTDFWGFRRALAWSGIERVERRRLLSLCWLRILARDGGRPLWVPLFLADRAGFAAAVEALAPEDNPVRVHLAARRGRGEPARP